MTANSQNGGIGYKNHNDWRLPSLTELRSLVVITAFNPAINATAFPATPFIRPFRSSTVYQASPTFAWGVNFTHGNTSAEMLINSGYVRLVRSGQAPVAAFDGFPGALSPATQTLTGTVGTAITPTTAFTPTNFSGVMNYTISPTLPGGLAMNALTGVISGTPTAAQASTSHTVTATGSTSGSATATISLTVAQGTQTITFVGPTPPPTYAPGGTFNVSATASSGLAVAYSSQTPSVCTVTGTTVTIVTAGPCTIAADQAGNANWTAAAQVTQTITIAQATTTVTVTGSHNYTYSGTAQGPATSTVTGSGGSVTYSYSGTGLTTYGPSATRPTAAGSYQVSASVAADANYQSATSTAYAFSIAKAPLTITANGQSVAYGTPVNTVTSAGSYTPSGFVNSETAAVISGNATYTTTYTATTAPGVSVTLTPVTAGLSASNYDFTPATGSITITAATTTVTVTGSQNYTYSGTAQGPATSTVTGSGGSITYSYSGTGYPASATRPTAAGSYQVIASVAADANYQSATSNPYTFTLNKAPLTITANGQSVAYGTPVNTVTSAGSYTPSGFVNSETAAVISGSASYTTTYTATTAPGASVTLTPVTAGLSASNYDFTAVAGTITIVQASQSGLTATATPNSIGVNGTSTLNTTGGLGTGAVTYAVTLGNPCTVTGSTLTGVGAGLCTVTTTRAADTHYLAATSSGVSVTVNLNPQAALTLSASPTSLNVNGTSTLSINGGSGNGSVTYAVTSGPCSVVTVGVTGTLTGTGAGTCSVTASKAADSAYAAVTSSPISVSISATLAPQAPLTVTPSTSSVPAGQSVTLSTTGGSGNGTVTHSAVAQPDAPVQTANSRTVTTASVLTCGINGNILTPTGGAGRCLVTTTKAADSLYAAATAQFTITVTAAAPPPPANPIPTLGEWAQRVMLLLMIATAARHGRRLRAGD